MIRQRRLLRAENRPLNGLRTMRPGKKDFGLPKPPSHSDIGLGRGQKLRH